MVLSYIKKRIQLSTVTASVVPEISREILRLLLNITSIKILERYQLQDTSLQQEELPKISIMIGNDHFAEMMLEKTDKRR